MSNANSNPPQPNRRDQLKESQAKAAREAKVRNIITFSILGVAILAIIGTLVWVVVSAGGAGGGAAATGGTGGTGEAGSENQYTVLVGSADAPVTVDIFQDYMCPYCGQFERANRDDLEAMVSDGTARLRIHPMSFLDGSSQGTKYSTRAANALVTVAKAEPDKVMAFNAALYDNQPEENTQGLTDAQIADFARQAGVSNDTIAAFAAMSNQEFVENATNAAFAAGVTGTPTVQINGEKFSGDLYTAGALKTAVTEAAAK